jgi:hypothetical protein
MSGGSQRRVEALSCEFARHAPSPEDGYRVHALIVKDWCQRVSCVAPGLLARISFRAVAKAIARLEEERA